MLIYHFYTWFIILLKKSESAQLLVDTGGKIRVWGGKIYHASPMVVMVGFITLWVPLCLALERGASITKGLKLSKLTSET